MRTPRSGSLIGLGMAILLVLIFPELGQTFAKAPDCSGPMKLSAGTVKGEQEIMLAQDFSMTPPNNLPPPESPPFFMTRLLTANDLLGKTKWELDVMRNEIYARYGRMFLRKDLQDYFSAQSWYEPKHSPEDFPESALSNIQQKNVKFIADYQKGTR